MPEKVDCSNSTFCNKNLKSNRKGWSNPPPQNVDRLCIDEPKVRGFGTSFEYLKTSPAQILVGC